MGLILDVISSISYVYTVPRDRELTETEKGVVFKTFLSVLKRKRKTQEVHRVSLSGKEGGWVFHSKVERVSDPF